MASRARTTVCALAVFAGGLVMSGMAWGARPAGGVSIKNYYYSDASLTVKVAERDYNCQGLLWAWGTPTMYQTFTVRDCVDAGGPKGPGPEDPVYHNCTMIYTPYPEAICSG